MNEFVIALTAALGAALGYTIGILSKNPEESNHTRELEKSVMEDLQKGFAKREAIYRAEINRLHDVIAQSARDRVAEHPEAAKMTDFVEISLERGGYKEIDLSGRAKR